MFEDALMRHTGWQRSWAAPYVVDADAELADRICGTDMINGYTMAAVGFYAPQGRMIRLPLADPRLNEKIESFRDRLLHHSRASHQQCQHRLQTQSA